LPRVWRLASSEGVLDPVERVGVSDRDLEAAVGHQVRQLGEPLGGGDRVRALGARSDPGGGLPVDDRVDALGPHTELDRKLDVSASEGVDEGIDSWAGRVPDRISLALAVCHRDDPVLAEPVVVSLAGQPDHRGAGAAGKLGGERAHAARRSRDDHCLAFVR
jgi:hypothetical protein